MAPHDPEPAGTVKERPVEEVAACLAQQDQDEKDSLAGKMSAPSNE